MSNSIACDHELGDLVGYARYDGVLISFFLEFMDDDESTVE